MTSVSLSSPPLPVTICNAPSGNPASRKISAITIALSGVCVAGFNTTVLPTANAGPNLCATKLNGKLNGVMADITPKGSLFVQPIRSPAPGAASIGTVSPFACLAPSAAN